MGTQFRKRYQYLLSSATALLGLTAVQGAAQAQIVGSDAPAASAGPASDIVVTGSRIRRPNETQATPITTVSSEVLEGRGVVNVAEMLNTVPAIGASTLSASGAPRNTLLAGLYALDLRALGNSRTLVLVDGRRYVSSLQGGSAVDISTIPTDLIDRVDITTGGGSAVYGSDAVSGVVNFVLKRKFTGLEFKAQSGITSRGDGAQRKVSLLGGTDFAGGRGNVMVNLSYDDTDPIYAVDRSISADGVTIANPLRPDLAVFGPASYTSLRTVQGVFGLNGSTVSGATVRRTVLPDGTITTPLGSRDGMNPNLYNIVVSPMKRFLAYGRATYEVSDSISAFLDAAYSRNTTVQQFEPTFINSGTGNIGGSTGLSITIPVSNPFIPPTMRALIPGTRGDIAFARDFPEFGPRVLNYERQLYRAVAGLQGDLPSFGKGWHWEAYYEYGRSTLDETMHNGIDTARLYEALRVEPNGTGGYRCANASARAQGCVPVNLFTGQRLTAAEVSYLRQSVDISSFNEQQVAAVSATGGLFDLPGGPLSIAIGGEYRREKSNYQPDAALSGGTTSLLFAQATKGQFNVKEAYIEATAPLLSDLPFAYRLELEGAYRYADYSTSGGVSAWKVGGNYAPIKGIRLRGVYSRDVRAPNINDLFRGATSNRVNVTDRCLNGGTGSARTYCLAQPGVSDSFVPPAPTSVSQLTLGNTDLQPEIARTLTAGIVLQPAFVPGLTVSVDYYRIKIDNAITSLAAQTVIDQCAATNNPVYCSTIVRDPASGVIVQQNTVPINAASEKMRGIDVEVDYRAPIDNVFGADLGDSIAATLTYTRLLGYDQTPYSRAPAISLKGQPFYPQNKANLNIAYTNGAFTATANGRYLGKAYRVVGAEFAGNSVPDYLYVDLQLRVAIDKRHSFYVGGTNLTDVKPPLFPVGYTGTSTGTNTAASVYSLVGSSFYAGLDVKF